MPTVLIADDSLSVRKVAERLLLEAGLEVALAANAEEAMTWMSDKHPDLVIADVIMPGKSGYEVCAYIRSHASLADTPVLLVSGFVDDEVTRQAEACHADGIIKKPFQGTSLRERVLGLLSGRKEQVPEAVPEPVIATLADEAFQPVVPDISAAPAPAQLQAWEARLQAFQESVMQALTNLDKQLQALHESTAQAVGPVKALEAQLAEQANRIAQFEHTMKSFRESTAQAVTQVQDLETRLDEEERQYVTLQEQLTGLGPGRENITQALTDMGKQLQDLRDSTTRATGPAQLLQTRIAEQEKRLAQFEQKLQSTHETPAPMLVQQVEEMKTRMAEAEKHVAVLQDRLAALEPIAASTEKLVQALTTFARHSSKPGEGNEQ
jgi:DNA-binding response OmpR family regulator